MRSSDFFRLLPAATREHLPPGLRKFRSETRAWLTQLYYADPRMHYEAWNLGRQRGLLEIGLHFESRDRAANQRYLAEFQRCLFEIKTALGRDWEAEPWDKGWTKVYTTLELEGFSDAYLERTARRLAKVVTVLQPIFEEI